MVALATMTGCAGSRNSVVKVGESTRQDVFQEITESKHTQGKAILSIEFQIKCFKGRFINVYLKHSDPPYTVTVNIDGQSVVLTDEPVLEDSPGDIKDSPEAGTGWKYSFRKALVLDPGRHHLTVTVPLSDVIVGKDVTLNPGINRLQLIPEYNSCVVRYSEFTQFNHGLNTIKFKLNDQIL
jgi:hypothetical protein